MSDVSELTARIEGTVLVPGDDDYDTERSGFDLSVTQRPAVIVAATGTADVISAVRYAHDHGFPVAVQATGHGITVPADDAVLITTHGARAVDVDPGTRTARVQAGARWSEVIARAAPFGLAPLSGSAPGVGAVSYTLGGGVGVLGRRWGFSADHVAALEVVDARGVLRRVTEHAHPDLFWALRGGGGNFGVVTAMQIELVELAVIYGGGLFFPGEVAGTVLGALLATAAEAPDELSLSAALMVFPDLPTVPAALRGRFCCHARVTWCGPPDDGEAAIRPLRSVAAPLLDTVRPMPVTDIGTIHNDPTTPRPTNSRSVVAHTVDQRFVDTVLAHAGPDCPYVIELRHLGGALAREPAVPNAVGHRSGVFNVYTPAYPAAPGSPTAATVRASEGHLVDDLAPWSDGGALVNFLAGAHVSRDDVRACYSPDIWARLVEIKTTWDPHNIFRINHNIPPAGTATRRDPAPAVRTRGSTVTDLREGGG